MEDKIDNEDNKLLLKENSQTKEKIVSQRNSRISESSIPKLNLKQIHKESSNDEEINMEMSPIKNPRKKSTNMRVKFDDPSKGTLNLEKVNTKKIENKTSESSEMSKSSSKKYNQIIKSFKSIKKDSFVDRNDMENSDSPRNLLFGNFKIERNSLLEKRGDLKEKNEQEDKGIDSLLKEYGNQQKKEDGDGLTLVNQLRNKLNDFQMDLQQIKDEDQESHKSPKVKEKYKFSEKKHQLVNMLPRKQTNDIPIRERIFWSKEKMHKVREKFLIAKMRIEKKTEDDFNDIRKCIEEGEIEVVVSTLLNEHFKAFYKLEIKKQMILEHMLIHNQPEILQRVLQDNFYEFDINFIFDYIGKKLNDKEKGEPINEEDFSNLLMNIIKFNLYSNDLAKLLAWFIGSFQYYNVFRYLVDKNNIFDKSKLKYNYFELDEDISDYINNTKHYNKTLATCLENNLQDLAIGLVAYQQEVKDPKIIDDAVKQNSLLFLRFVWDRQNMNKDEKSSTRKNMQSFLRVPPKSQSMLHFNFYSIHNFNNGNLVFHLSDLIKKFAKSIPFNSTAIHDIVSTWTYLEKDEKLLETLFDVRCFDEISTLIFRNPGVWKFTKNQFETLIEEGELDLILYYVKLRECRLILDDYENQKKIVNKYIKYGNRMYYGAEMLSYINKNNWNLNFTSDLLRYIERTIKTKDILNCHSPVLTCLLLCEFINQIAESSVQYRLHCEKVVLDLCNFCNSIQEANPEEKYIKFLMTQKDTKGRSAYQISADHHYYSVLKTPEIGTIVQKMWNGRLSHDGLMSFSSVAKYVESNSSRSLNPFENFESFDHNKTYYHQLSLWTESSSLRYWPESVSTILLISVYNYFIYFLVYRTNSDQPIKKLMQPISDLEDKDLKFFAYFFIFWTFSIVMNIPLQFLFGNLSGRKYRMDLWGYIEILTLLSSLCLLIDTTQIFPPTDDYGNIVPSDGQSDKAFILRAIILSVNDVLVWLRVTGIFLTFKNLGPLIRMISLLSLKTLKYLVVYALYFTACASVFTAIFYDKSDQFVSFSMTFTSLFVSFLNNPNAFGFNQYQVYGAIAVIFFTTVSGLLLSNLLIAVLSNEYEVLSDVVDASHRSVLISYFRRYKWDNKYGYLIYLTTPLNIVNFLALPFSIFFKRKKFNKYVCRLYHSLFYLPIIMLLQCVFMIILTPFAYLKGLFMMNSHQFFNQKGNALSKLSGVLNWIIFGFPYILIMNIRDMILLLQTVFKKIAVMSYEKNRIQKYITKDDIRVFLQFVHSRENDEANDLHTLFLDYLNFDQEHKAENDRNMKEKSAYMKRLKSAAGINNNKKSTRQQPGLIMYNNKTSNRNSSSHLGDPEPPQKTSQNSMIKRNLIIIEILENFLIDDGSDNFIVDIDKLKMLLPKTMNINNGYIKRILNTDISSLSKAVNKIKTKKNKFMQNKLLNKIVGATIRLDYFVDNEDKFDPLHKEIDRKKHKFEVDENEDDFYTELYNLLNKISIDIKSSIETANMKKNKNKETIVGKNKELKDSELEREHEIGGEE